MYCKQWAYKAWPATTLSSLPQISLQCEYWPSFLNLCVLILGSDFLPFEMGLCGIGLAEQNREHPVRTRIWRGRRIGLVVLHSCGHCMRGCHSCLCSIEVGFFLKLADVLLVPDSFVAKPVGHLQIREMSKKERSKGRAKKTVKLQYKLLGTKEVS